MDSSTDIEQVSGKHMSYSLPHSPNKRKERTVGKIVSRKLQQDHLSQSFDERNRFYTLSPCTLVLQNQSGHCVDSQSGANSPQKLSLDHNTRSGVQNTSKGGRTLPVNKRKSEAYIPKRFKKSIDAKKDKIFEEIRNSENNLKDKLLNLSKQLKYLQMQRKFDQNLVKKQKKEKKTKKMDYSLHLKLKQVSKRQKIQDGDDIYYHGELHHKCLNCQHFRLNKEQIRIPSGLNSKVEV